MDTVYMYKVDYCVCGYPGGITIKEGSVGFDRYEEAKEFANEHRWSCLGEISFADIYRFGGWERIE